jgi:hypothetical protein
MPGTRVAVATALLALGASVTGCSGGGDEAEQALRSSPTPSPSALEPSPSTSPSPSAEAPPAAPSAAKGPAGEKVFARHVMDLWGYALRTNDARPLLAASVAGKSCGGCKPLAADLARRKQQGWSVDFSGVTVHGITVPRKQPKKGPVSATATVDIPESDSFNDDGSYRNTNPAHAGVPFTVRMIYTMRGYRLVSFTVGSPR